MAGSIDGFVVEATASRSLSPRLRWRMSRHCAVIRRGQPRPKTIVDNHGVRADEGSSATGGFTQGPRPQRTLARRCGADASDAFPRHPGRVSRQGLLGSDAEETSGGGGSDDRPERGIRSRGVLRSSAAAKGTAILVTPAPKLGLERDARERAEIDRNQREWHQAGFATLELGNLRGVGEMAPIAGVVDHNGGRVGSLGRPSPSGTMGVGHHPLAGFRASTVRVYWLAMGAMGLPAILAAGLDQRGGWGRLYTVPRQLCGHVRLGPGRASRWG